MATYSVSFNVKVIESNFKDAYVGSGLGIAFAYLMMVDSNFDVSTLLASTSSSYYFNENNIVVDLGSSSDQRYGFTNGAYTTYNDSPAITVTTLGGHKNGYVYGYLNSSDAYKFYQVDGYAKIGQMSSNLVTTYDDGYSCRGSICQNQSIVPFYVTKSNQLYSYLDLNTSTVNWGWKNTNTIFHGKNGQGRPYGRIAHTWNGDDEYFFLNLGVYKYIHSYINGVHAWTDISSISSLDGDTSYSSDGIVYCFPFYDTSNDCIVLYISKVVKSSNTISSMVTEGYILSPSDLSVTSTFTVPDYLDISFPSGSSIATTARLLFNVSESTTVSTITDDILYLDGSLFLLYQSYVGYYDSVGDLVPKQAFMGACGGYSAMAYKRIIAYVDNLYMNTSDNNTILTYS